MPGADDLTIGAESGRMHRHRGLTQEELAERSDVSVGVTAEVWQPQTHIAVWGWLSVAAATRNEVTRNNRPDVAADGRPQAWALADVATRGGPESAYPRVTYQRFELDMVAAHLDVRQVDDAFEILARVRRDAGWLRNWGCGALARTSDDERSPHRSGRLFGNPLLL